MQTKANLQDMFLLQAKRDRTPVTMFLMNGFQMRGTITGFDAFVVTLESEGRQQIITSTPSPPSPPGGTWTWQKRKALSLCRERRT